MVDISEVFLQAAQVIGQNIRFQQQNEQEQARLQLEKSKQDEIISYHEQSLQMREEAFQAKQELDSLKLQVERMRAETGRMNAQTNQQNAQTNSYRARVQAALAESKLTDTDYVKLQKKLDAQVVGVRTGDPELDKGMIFQTQAELRNSYGKVRSVVQAGAPLPDEMQKVARLMHIPDQDYAAREMARIEKLLSFRDQFAQEKLIPEYKMKEANVLKAMSFLDDVQQTQDLSAQNTQSAQTRQGMDSGTQAVIGAPPGVIAGSLTPETQAGLSEVANFTAETLGSPDGFNASATKLMNLIRDRKLAGDHNGANAIGAAAAQKSPALAQRASDLYRSLYSTQK